MYLVCMSNTCRILAGWPLECHNANRLRWCGHVSQKEANDWVKKCMEYEVEGARPRGRPKKTWRESVEKDCQARALNREDAMDCIRWMKQIRDD